MLHMLQKAKISSLKVINRYFYTPVAAMSACCKSIVGSYTDEGSDRTLVSNVFRGESTAVQPIHSSSATATHNNSTSRLLHAKKL